MTRTARCSATASGCLPAEKRGYYREYTVRRQDHATGEPGALCVAAPRTPDACYYTADHYASFRKIVE
jgi:ribonuclease T1